MMRMLKNVIYLFFVLIIFSLVSSHIVLAANADILDDVKDTKPISDLHIQELSTKSEACLLMDAKSGKILYAKNAEKQLYPASTTKLMTAILTLENCKLTDTATVSHEAIFSIPVRIFSCEFKRR